MPIIPLGYADGNSSNEELAKIRMRNMYLTENRYSPDKLTRFSRPTVDLFADLGIEPIYGVFYQEGALDSDWYVVCGERLYKIGTYNVPVLIGPIPGAGICQFAATVSKLMILRNGIVYTTDGTTIYTVTMPDNRLVGSIATIDNYFIMTQLGYYRFYWMTPTETDPDALSYASAERSPDSIVAVAVISDEIWFIGADNVEVWQTTGDKDAPYQRISGRVYSYGCADPNSVVNTIYNGLPCILWVSQKGSVVMGQGNTDTVSTKAVELALQGATNYRAWSFRWNRTEFYILTTDQKTFVYNIDNQTWATWDSYGHDNFRGHLGFQVNQDVYAGDSVSGKIWKFTDGYSDNGEQVVREISGFLVETSTKAMCFSVNARINAGWPPNYDYTPMVEMRFSDDYGFTYSPYYQIQMGPKGAYDFDVTWRSLGDYGRPGREFEFRFSDIAKFRIDYATINEV